MNQITGQSSVAQDSKPAEHTLDDVYHLVAEEFQRVNELIPNRLTSDVEMVEEIGRYIVESGGKRLRPMLVLLSSQALGVKGDQHIHLAAIIEFLHTATLLHDDVVDNSVLRRGRATVNDRWGNAPSVLVGDFLYSRAFQLMVELASLKVMEILARATNTIAEGEVMQLANIGNCAMSEADYREVIRCKTALLFEAASHTGALLAAEQTSAPNPSAAVPSLQPTASQKQDPAQPPMQPQVQALKDFGLHFGMAYQLIDDWLDYAGSTEVMGKNVGDDLAEGKLTLPLIHALRVGSAADQQTIRNAIDARSCDSMESIRRIVQTSGALEYTRQAAMAEIEQAQEQLAAVPDSPYRQALQALAQYSLSRLT
jgi:octaprenyl-diphosphate synthase